jgi:hypothetical protein
MKNQNLKFYRLTFWIFILATFLLFSCGTKKWMVPSEFIGNWESGKNKITVRFKLSEQQQSQFISDSVTIKIRINNDKTVSGFIGQAAIDNGKIVKSRSFPGLKEVEYQIECNLTGKIFDKDPIDSKEVDIWLSQINENGKIKGDVRSGGSVFPMGMVLFEKVNK